MLSGLLRRFGLGRLAHNIVLGTFWQFARVGAQALWVIVIARNLGPSGYGTFAGTAGLAVALGGLTGLGTGYLLLQAVSRDHAAFGVYWRKALLTTLITGPILAVIFAFLAVQIIGHAASIGIVTAVAISELICYPLVYACAFAFQAHEQLGWASALTTLMAVARLLAAILFWATDVGQGLEGYVWFHLVASFAIAAFAIVFVQRLLRPKRVRYTLNKNEIREGMSFSTVWFTTNAMGELDKALTLRLAGSEITGLYAAAFRMATVFALPIMSLAMAAQPRLFRHRSEQVGDNPHLVRHLLLVALGYAAVASVVLWLTAGILPVLLGAQFENSARAARMLALLLPFNALRVVGSAVLVTSGKQLLRALTESMGIIALITFALLWIPKYGLTGAIMATIATEALLAALMWAAVSVNSRSNRNGAVQP